MSMYFFTYRGATEARRGAAALRKSGVPARIDRSPVQLSKSGCGYGLWVVPQKAEQAAKILRREATYERSYRMDRGGFREAPL
ncbi:MAG: DUF3343 domain-containing protein [Oscillospiraceae bacterium]|nr:DUF3343 domain-containing protein [Oscillospiraceae bacterium]